MATWSYLSIITLNVNGLNAPTKRQRLAEWIQKQDPYIYIYIVYKRPTSKQETHTDWKWNSSTLATSYKELTHWKTPDAGRDWGQEEKGTTEDEMAGWHHILDGPEFEWTRGVGVGLGGLACCDSWGCKGSDRTEWLYWTVLNWNLLSPIIFILLVNSKNQENTDEPKM